MSRQPWIGHGLGKERVRMWFITATGESTPVTVAWLHDEHPPGRTFL